MDQNFEEILKQVSAELSIPLEQVKRAVDTYFKSQKGILQRDDMPHVLVHNLGRFVPHVGRLKRKLIFLRRALKEGRISEEDHNKEKERITTIIEREQKNKHVRRG